MASVAAMSVIVNCDTAAEVANCLVQINAWMVNNPSKVATLSTTGKKITLIFSPYEVWPS